MSAPTPTGAGIAADNTPPDRLLSSVVSAMADCVAEVERLRAALRQISEEARECGFQEDDWPRTTAEAALAPKEPSE